MRQNHKFPAFGSSSEISRSTRHTRAGIRRRRALSLITVVATALLVGCWHAPLASADFADNLRSAVTQARGGSSCAPLRPEPLADQAAAVVAHSTASYLDHNARAVPIADPLPVLKDVGLNVGRAKLLQGAGQTESDAIKVVMITGFRDLPDCSYTVVGISTLPNNNSGNWFLSVAILGGP